MFIGIDICSSHASATTACKQSRPKEVEKKDQAKQHLTVTSVRMEVRRAETSSVLTAPTTDQISAIEVCGFKPTRKVCEHNRVAHASHDRSQSGTIMYLLLGSVYQSLIGSVYWVAGWISGKIVSLQPDKDIQKLLSKGNQIRISETNLSIF